MALTDTQKLKVRLALREPLECQNAIDTQILRINAATETYLITLITAWDSVSTDTTEMVVDGVKISNPRTKAELAAMIGNTTGWLGGNDLPVIMGRGFIEDYNGYGAVSQSLDSGWSE